MISFDEISIQDGKFGRRLLSPGCLASQFYELDNEEKNELRAAIRELFNSECDDGPSDYVELE